MEASAQITSKGQVTVPKAVREALGISAGDRVIFRVDANRAIMARTPDLLSLAGAVEVPASKRGVSWDEIVATARRRWAESAL